MARVANCPQCEHELLVPNGADGEAWAKCPECRAFFQMKQVTSREVAAALLVEADESAPASEPESKLDEVSSATNWKDTADDDSIEPEAAKLDLSSSDESPKPGETLEAAAQRIDEWFRSAKTLPDAPPTTNDLAEIDSTALSDEILEDDIPASAPRIGATIDFSADDMDDMEISQDFELEDAAGLPSGAAWDDPDHMDELLADIDNPTSDDMPNEMQTIDISATDNRPEFLNSPPNDDVPDVVAMNGGKRRRKRSPVRTLLMVTVAGIIGLALGYYALLWMRGPSMDFLQVAKYLPPAMLPSSFDTKQPTQLAINTTPQNTAPETVAPETETSDTEIAPPETISATEESTTEPETPETIEAVPVTETETPAEIQAGFTTTEDPSAADPNVGGRYADSANATDTLPTEPAEIADQPAAELITEPEMVEPVRIEGTPSFTSSDLSAALDVAKNAQPSLIEGNFTDGPEVARAKGLSYAALADLAQKAAFAEAPAEPAGASPLQQATDDLFRQTLSDPRIRGEVAVILPKWIGSKNRKHGGVFFAGNVASEEQQGSVSECRVELENGQSITILTPPATADAPLDTARPQAIIGWIVDRPAEQINGYTGSAKQAIWASRLVPLE